MIDQAMVQRAAETAARLVAAPRGILAVDESTRTLTARFSALGIASTPSTRRDWRELLVRTPGLAQFISGVILYDETVRRRSSDGVAFPELVATLGLFPGVKVDTGAHRLAGFEGELVTEGLDGLRARLEEYAAAGCRFAKWRAVLSIGPGRPSRACVAANAHALARYAGACEAMGLAPIVEPEVLVEGDHDLERCAEVTVWVLRSVFAALAEFDAALEALVLKPSMVLPGAAAPHPADPSAVAASTVACYRRAVPAAVAGIALLSGGQDDIAAATNLDAIQRHGPLPWRVPFSYGRALQDAAMAAWLGEQGNAHAAQAALARRAQAYSLASVGRLREAEMAVA